MRGGGWAEGRGGGHLYGFSWFYTLEGRGGVKRICLLCQYNLSNLALFYKLFNIRYRPMYKISRTHWFCDVIIPLFPKNFSSKGECLDKKITYLPHVVHLFHKKVKRSSYNIFITLHFSETQLHWTMVTDHFGRGLPSKWYTRKKWMHDALFSWMNPAAVP